MKRFLVLFLGVLAAAALAGCSSDSRLGASGTGTVHLLLTDAPAAYDHVYLDVREVWIRGEVDTIDDTPDSTAALLAMDDDDDSAGWVRLDVTPQVVDLLTLRNGVFLGLASGVVPAGRYDEIRLVLGPANSIVVDGVTHDLKVPSGQQSGLKLKGAFEVPAGGTADVGIDFDAARSVVLTGNGKYILKPVVRVHPVPTTGTITGEVEPDDFPSAVYAIAADDTVATSVTDTDGKFALALLLPGNYRVSVAPTSEAYADTTLDGVSVTAGNTTSLGTIVLTPVPAPAALVAR